MQRAQLAEFHWNSQRETIEQCIRGQQRDALMFWMLQHHDGALTIQTMQHIHELTTPVEVSTTISTAKTKYLAANVTEAAIALRRGSNAAVCHCMSELVDLCTRYIQHIESRPAR